MKIGILTFHRAYNYGAVLQCYALQQYLLSMGHNVEVIDYRQPWIEECYKPFSPIVFIHHLKHNPRNALGYIKSYFIRKKILSVRSKHFLSFLSEYIKLSPYPVHTINEIPNSYDAYVIGSDQLWGKECMGNKLDDVYLGNFNNSKVSRIIGYAISSDHKSIKKLYDEKRLTASLYKFSSISFRESSISHYIQELEGVSCPITIDPTLLTDEKLWEPLINDEWETQNFVAIYQVRGGRKLKSILYNKAWQMAKQFGDCSIIDLSNMCFSVADFLSIIKYAKFVITSSFHATVFSIIFKTPFYVIKNNDVRDCRYVDLCTVLGLDKQCIDKNNCTSDKYVDFSDIDIRLAALRQQSVSFITNSLK